MTNQTDQELVQDYAKTRSETAFDQLVRRHVDLVYSAARRMVVDPHQAKDVTQGVFSALAQNAPQLTDHPVLSGWLHRTAQNLAAKTVRTNVRRQAREQEAVVMNELLSAGPDFNWEHISPHLDAALGELSEPDRDAVMLRYFEKKSAPEMARFLGISDEAAQKRVTRAVERLRDFFAKRGITIGASGLIVVISANAVQAAPAGLAAAISTAALASTAVITAKTIAFSALQKITITCLLTVAAGTVVYEVHQAAEARAEIQALHRQEMPLAGQLRQLQNERDEATNRLAGLLAENQQLKSDPNENELLKLRGQYTQLKTAQVPRANDSTASLAKSWLDRVSQLHAYLEKHQEKQVPEFEFLREQRWLDAVEPGLLVSDSTNLDEFILRAAQSLRWAAESDFGVHIQMALRNYADANDGQFPASLSQLRPYCPSKVADLLEQLYTIKPASILPADEVKEMNIKTDWVVVRQKQVISNSSSRGAYFADGELWWQSPPGRDEQ